MSNSYLIFPKINYNLLTIINLDKSTNPQPNNPAVECPLTNEYLQKIIYNTGPVIGTINNKSWWSNNGQPAWANAGTPLIGDASTTPSENANHTVIITGWGTYLSKKYWIIKNSWGAGWAWNGYTAIFWSKDCCSMFNSIAYVDPNMINMNQIKNTPGWKAYPFTTPTIQAPPPSNKAQTLTPKTFKQSAPPPQIAKAITTTLRFGGVKSDKDLEEGRDSVLYPTAINKKWRDVGNEFLEFFCWATKQNYLKHSITSRVQDQGKCLTRVQDVNNVQFCGFVALTYF